MAIHYSVSDMLQESLVEMVLVADYCIKYRKNIKEWGSSGCFGYPAAILLLSVADSIGSYVLGGYVGDHFNILKHRDYYNLNLSDGYIDIIYKKYRNLLNHNAVMAVDCILDIGMENGLVFELKDNKPVLNLLPLLNVTKKAVAKFLERVENIVISSQQLQYILQE